MTITVSVAEIRNAATAACINRGASPAAATALVDATLSAECNGRPEMGLAHLLDYLDGLSAGRIAGQVEPQIAAPLPAIVTADGNGGIAQLGFDRAFSRIEAAANSCGLALFTQHNCYTAGELGYYVRRLAQRGLVSLAFANSHAMMAPAPGLPPVYGTNPFAFAAPRVGNGAILAIDQATSATAFVNLMHAAERGEEIPAGWATDQSGRETSDPAAAMLGALLPAGGRKGANLALMVEVMAAGLASAHWSFDAGNFRDGAQCPETGLTIVAIAAHALDPDFAERLDVHLERLRGLGVHIPGAAAQTSTPHDNDPISVAPQVWSAIRRVVGY